MKYFVASVEFPGFISKEQRDEVESYVKKRLGDSALVVVLGEGCRLSITPLHRDSESSVEVTLDGTDLARNVSQRMTSAVASAV